MSGDPANPMISRRTLLQSTAAVSAAARKGAASPSSTAPGAPGGRVFLGEGLREIAFPLGGIGTGTISLGGLGNLRDWEIFNRPNKGGTLPFTFACLRLAGGGLKRPVVRVLERAPLPPYSGGFGEHRERALGLPRFREAVFEGAYPFARIRFEDAKLPVTASLTAFNPMIPLDVENSSLPVAVLTYKLSSRASSPLNVAVAMSAMNPVGYDGKTGLWGQISDRRVPFFGRNVNEYRSDGSVHGVLMTSRKYGPDSPRYGSMAVSTLASDVSYRLAWEHGEWWDDFQKWWDEFSERGRFSNAPAEASPDGATEYATLASHFTLAPGETKAVDFVVSWHFPNIENYAEPQPARAAARNAYGARWHSAWEPAVYLLKNLPSLRRRSERYRDALYSSSLPPAVVDAVSSQASILRTNTILVGENNVVMAFEGCGDHEGCCPMNCTHVFNYEQALAHLYPSLERSMRELDFLVNMRPDGSMSFRTTIPPRPGGDRNVPAADGQMGCIMKVYREWQLSGDETWLRRLWPQVKRALEYAWAQWDADRDGVMEGIQHNTYDINFHGPNSMMGSLYLGALAAAARMAEHLGEGETAAVYRDLGRKGAARLDRLLWNGSYYVQKVDASKPAKYQYGEGCLSDQLLGQWFAEVIGLGKLLPGEHIRTALRSIWQNNFRRGFDDFANAQRIYALNDEAGLLLCSWPRGGRPELPFVYADEVWTGVEYQVAAHLFYEGMVDEGLAIVEAVRARYDGVRRNPWDEVECGHHYARAMSSWSLLTAFSGFHYSAPEREMEFRPRKDMGEFRCLFVAGSSWGTYSQTAAAGVLQAAVAVEEGELELRRLRIPFSGSRARVQCRVPLKAVVDRGVLLLEFEQPLRVTAGSRIDVDAREL
ncbi:MAG: GH116 family glycosyl hydrolase [Acidobacteriota bacterium]